MPSGPGGGKPRDYRARSSSGVSRPEDVQLASRFRLVSRRVSQLSIAIGKASQSSPFGQPASLAIVSAVDAAQPRCAGLRDRRRLLGHRLLPGPARARHPVRLLREGLPVGGNWRYMNDNGMSSAYDSLSINTSRRIMEYAAYPMPEDYPDFPTHRQIAAYFDDYVDHFGFRDRIRFRTEVTSVERARGRLGGHALDDGTTTTLRVGVRGQRPPLGPALARAAVPGRVRRRGDPRPPLQDPRGLRGQERARARHRQLRLRHRGGDLAGVEPDLSRDAPRRVGDP